MQSYTARTRRCHEPSPSRHFELQCFPAAWRFAPRPCVQSRLCRRPDALRYESHHHDAMDGWRHSEYRSRALLHCLLKLRRWRDPLPPESECSFSLDWRHWLLYLPRSESYLRSRAALRRGHCRPSKVCHPSSMVDSERQPTSRPSRRAESRHPRGSG